VREGSPGRRFEDTHERNRIDNRIVRLGVASLGCFFIVGAGVTFWLPGPQVVVAIMGLAMVGSQSETAARLMDRVEVFARRQHRERWIPFRYKRLFLFASWCAFTAACLTVFWGVWKLGLLPGWIPVVG